MEQLDFSKIIKVLMISYPYYFKDMDKENTIMLNQLYYSKLKKYNYNVVANAINKIIETKEFMPTLAEIINECDKEYKKYYKQKIDSMYKNGYFKTDEEYGKALQWLFEEKPIVPQWLLKDINEVKMIGDKNDIN